MGCAALAHSPVTLGQTSVWASPTTNGSWFTATNWNPRGVPVATTQVRITGFLNANVDRPGAAAASVSVEGNSLLIFLRTGSAGTMALNVVNRGAGSNGGLTFQDTATAAQATINLSGVGGTTLFNDAVANFEGSSTLASASLTTGNGAQAGFYDNSTAGQGRITNNNGGMTAFIASSSAGSATLTNNAGGLTTFWQQATGGAATVVNNAGGVLDIALKDASFGGDGGVAIGSVSGAGNIYLGGSTLTLGALGRADTISGVLADGFSPQLQAYLQANGLAPPAFAGGALVKLGTGTLTLTGSNSYTGNTTVEGGGLNVQGGAINSPAATVRVGNAGNGSLRVEAGGRIADAAGVLGANAGSQGAAVVTGSGSQWANSSGLMIGNAGSGTLTISEGATVSASATQLALLAGSVGTLNIGGAIGTAAAAPGRLDSASLALGEGNASVNFNHTSASYEFAALMTGRGSVNALAGTTFLLADNSYAGATTIAPSATLQLGNGGAAGRIDGDVANNGTLAFDRADTLSFSGLISGAGRVVQQGSGTLLLAPSAAGGNTYSGGTLLQQGVLAIPADDVLGAPSGSLRFDGGTLQWGGSFGLSAARPISIEAGGATLDTQGFEAIVEQGMSGAGALTKTGAGSLILQGDNSFGGGTTVSAGTLVVGDAGSPGAALSGGGTVVVNAGATLGGYGSVTGDVVNNGTLKVADAIADAATDTALAAPAAKLSGKAGVLAKPAVLAGGNGGFTIRGTLQNAGLAQIGAASGTPGNTLTVGSYVGAPGSQVALNTFLGGDNAPSDKLVVNGGSASGASTLQIRNAGGGGALTMGDGIVVVDAVNGATTAASAFGLGGARVAAGAYEYLLVRGGAANGQSWYLRTTLPPEPPTVPVPVPTDPSQPPAPSTPGSATPPPPGTPSAVAAAVPLPNYRVEVPLDMAVPALANRLSLAMLGTYHDRAGEDSVNAGSEGPGRMGAWGRVFGGSGDVRNGSGGSNAARFDDFTRNGPSYDVNEGGAQAGIDLLRRVDAAGWSDVAGTYLALGHIDSNVDALYAGAAGSASLDAYSLGGYWTRKSAAGAYLDGVLQGTRYDNVKTKSIYAEKFATDGWGVSGSLEGGYPLALGAGWALEPQGQLVYQWAKLDDGADSLARISYDDTSSFYGRIGARLTRRIAQGEGQGVTAWARLNIWHAFDADATTTFSNLQGFNPVALSAPLGASTWAQAGVGLSGPIARNASAFASVDYNRALGGDDGHGWGGRIGVRFSW